MEIDWNQKMRPKGPKVKIIETDAKPPVGSAGVADRRELYEVLDSKRDGR